MHNKSIFKRTVFLSMVLFLWTFQYSIAQQLDYKILQSINSKRISSLDPTLSYVSNSADFMALGVPIFYVAKGIINKDNSQTKLAIESVSATLASYGTAYILKNTIKRNRPFIDHVDIQNYKNDSGYSFPSGSTTSIFSTATTLSLQSKKWYVILPSYIYASTVAYSRLHLGAHYPSDVIAGALLGSTSAFINHKLFNYINKRHFTKK
jgi:membrane-associated phospholipid phosphatase